MHLNLHGGRAFVRRCLAGIFNVETRQVMVDVWNGSIYEFIIRNVPLTVFGLSPPSQFAAGIDSKYLFSITLANFEQTYNANWGFPLTPISAVIWCSNICRLIAQAVAIGMEIAKLCRTWHFILISLMIAKTLLVFPLVHS